MAQFTMKDFAEFLAIIDKMKIQCNDNLSTEEKEILKSVIDEIKKQIK